MAMETARRLRIYLLSPEWIIGQLRGPPGRCFMVVEVGVWGQPLPDDARVQGVEWDESRNLFLVRVESATFDLVPEGHAIPTGQGPFLSTIDIDRGSWRDREPLL